MKTELVIITPILCIAGSCTKKVYIPLNTVTTITERLVDTVIKVNLQVYRDTITTPDTISHLVNPYCESWAKKEGCREFASDCQIDNTDSLLFHKAAGFEEAGRIICFCKKL